MVVEIHVAAKDDPGEVYMVEAWGAVATRANKIEHKAYEFTKFFSEIRRRKSFVDAIDSPYLGFAARWI
jgi:hypothetical protein